MTDGTNQALRAAARNALASASDALVGRPGLSADAQLEIFDKAEALIEDALEALSDARDVVEERAQGAAQKVSAASESVDTDAVAEALNVLTGALTKALSGLLSK